jgi:hypothetical protein
LNGFTFAGVPFAGVPLAGVPLDGVPPDCVPMAVADADAVDGTVGAEADGFGEDGAVDDEDDPVGGLVCAGGVFGCGGDGDGEAETAGWLELAASADGLDGAGGADDELVCVPDVVVGEAVCGCCGGFTAGCGPAATALESSRSEKDWGLSCCAAAPAWVHCAEAGGSALVISDAIPDTFGTSAVAMTQTGSCNRRATGSIQKII